MTSPIEYCLVHSGLALYIKCACRRKKCSLLITAEDTVACPSCWHTLLNALTSSVSRENSLNLYILIYGLSEALYTISGMVCQWKPVIDVFTELNWFYVWAKLLVVVMHLIPPLGAVSLATNPGWDQPHHQPQIESASPPPCIKSASPSHLNRKSRTTPDQISLTTTPRWNQPHYHPRLNQPHPHTPDLIRPTT